MYERGRRAQERLKARRESAVRDAEGCTFRPKITRRARRSASPGPAARARTYDRAKMLADRQRAKERAEDALVHFVLELIVVPQFRRKGVLSAAAGFLERARAAEGAGRRKNRAKAMEEKEAREMGGATFQPNVRRSRSGQGRVAVRGPLLAGRYSGRELGVSECRVNRHRCCDSASRKWSRKSGTTGATSPRESREGGTRWGTAQRPTSTRKGRARGGVSMRETSTDATIHERLAAQAKDREVRRAALVAEKERRELAGVHIAPNARSGKEESHPRRGFVRGAWERLEPHARRSGGSKKALAKARAGEAKKRA